MRASELKAGSSRTSVEVLLGREPIREFVPQDRDSSARWHTHDFPSPLARWNSHPEFEIHLILKSHGRFIVGDHIGTFGPGQLTLVGPDLPHDWISDAGQGDVILERDVVFQFHPDWIEECARVLPEVRELDGLWARAARGIEFSGDAAEIGAQHLLRIGQSRGIERVTHIFGLLQELARAPESEHRLLSNPWIPVPSDAEASAIVGEAIEYVVRNLHDDVRLSDAARIAGMSSSAFSRYFKRASGHTFSTMVRRMRLTRASTLLQHSTTSVSAIALEVGYGNLSNFNRQFLAEYGETPTQARRRSVAAQGGACAL